MSNPQPQPASLDDRVRDIIESFRPVTQAHGGDVEFVAVSPERVVQVRLKGTCAGCPASTMTLQMGLEQLLRAQVPEIARVENVG
jgi:Fe-S cluster biogenesis protein NfuA